MALVQKFYAKTLVFRRADEFAFIGINIEVLGGINQAEVLNTLYNGVN
jgi:hypothetical protein